MSRDIKFRCWYNDKMWYPETLTNDDNETNLIFFNPLRGIKWGLYDSHLENRVVSGEYGSIMQYTGLPDRDKNEIYEGDIVSLRYWHNNPPSKRPKQKFITVQLPVIFSYGEFKPDDQTIRSTDYGTIYGNWWEHCAVVGNIYENSDLIIGSQNEKQ